MVEISVLKKLPSFKSFTDEELKALGERLIAETADAGKSIFHENQIGDDSMFFIQEGAVKITKKYKTEEKVLANLKDGEFFGEMSMLMPAPRSASAVAIRPCRLVRFSDRDYADFKKTQPAIVVKFNEIFLKALISRLRDADKRLVKDGYGIGAL